MTDEDLRWRVTSQETAYRCPGFEIVHEDVVLPDGTQTDFDYLSEPQSVVILPFTVDGDVVVIEEWRQAVDRVNLGLPAGTVEPEDTDLREAAARELAEETGYSAASIEPLGAFEPANGFADSCHNYFLANGCRPDAAQNHDPDESIRVDTRTFEALHDATLSGEFRDGRSALALLLYAERERDS